MWHRVWPRFCIYTNHDSNRYSRLLKPDSSNVAVLGSEYDECTSAARWQITVPETTQDGTDWATATGDGERVLIYSPSVGQYLGYSGTNVVWTTSWTAAESWKISLLTGFIHE